MYTSLIGGLEMRGVRGLSNCLFHSIQMYQYSIIHTKYIYSNIVIVRGSKNKYQYVHNISLVSNFDPGSYLHCLLLMRCSK